MKKTLLGFVVVFVLCSIANFVVHGLVLQPYYNQVPQLVRPPAEGQAHMPYMMAAFAVFSFAFVWVYARGAESKPWLGQGLRFGLAIWLLASMSRYLIYFSVQPWPASVVLLQIGLELPMMLSLGVAAAALIRK
jgi:hypothetical protein